MELLITGIVTGIVIYFAFIRNDDYNTTGRNDSSGGVDSFRPDRPGRNKRK